MKTNYAQVFDQKKNDLENFISDRLVSLALYTVRHGAVDTLDRVAEERGRIMVEVNRAFGYKKETPSG